MLSFALPGALLGLVLLPLVWWLQQFDVEQTGVQVSAGFLFDSDKMETTASVNRRFTTPLQWLRLLIVFLVVLALARPYWRSQEGLDLVVWVDNSLSMQTHEGISRLDSGVTSVADAIQALPPAEVEIRYLNGTGKGIPLDHFLSQQSRPDPSASLIPSELESHRTHWLLTDGADDIVNQWSADMNRTFNVGEASHNVALTNLGVRRSVESSAFYDAVVTVDVFDGDNGTTRILNVATDTAPQLIRRSINTSGGRQTIALKIPKPAGTLKVTLSEGDSLPLDDGLSIDLGPLNQVSISVTEPCDARFLRAMRANPGIRLVTGHNDADLFVQCGGNHPGVPEDAPQLVWLEQAEYETLTGALKWTVDTSISRALADLPLMLDTKWVRLAADAPTTTTDTLVSAPDKNRALVYREGKRLQVSFDLMHPELQQQPAYPLMVNWLVEVALMQPVLDPVVSVSRPVAESAIQNMAGPGAENPPVLRNVDISLVPTFIVSCLLLMLIEILMSAGLPGRLLGSVRRG